MSKIRTRAELRKRYHDLVAAGDLVGFSFREFEEEELHGWADAAYDEMRDSERERFPEYVFGKADGDA